ncbi:MAG: class II aldolase/adducin family protein [Tissierellia bacterium]|nr:class II aldolase/adducin family protein [Tissierellia bacterium]
MTIEEGRGLVIKAGLKLTESGLIARTWGNISCRIDEDRFLITPSGRDYRTLTPDEIVEVNISDCSHKGDIKPSSEKGIHADVYSLFPDINFVIHTHQQNASVISATGLDSIELKSINPYLGDRVICADYALPGTKSLRRKVSKALLNSTGNGVIMKYHGALCIGRDYDEAFTVASQLEEACHEFIIDRYLEISGRESYDPQQMYDFILSLEGKVEGEGQGMECLPSSSRTKTGLILYYDDGKEVEIKADNKYEDHSLEVEIHRAIYDRYEDIDYILFKSTPDIRAIARLGIDLKPLMDDFAQIVGTVARNVEANSGDILAALKRSSAVLIKDSGALCCGSSKEDATAVGMIMEKGCKAYIGASLFGRIKPINFMESLLMRFIYQKKYSKQIDK